MNNNQIQFTLTVNAGKWLIARAISELECIKTAKEKGKIILFGGTTVSALTEILTGKPIRLSGRITPRGTVTAYEKKGEVAHTLLINDGKYYDIENQEAEPLLAKLGSSDVIVTGANGYDVFGDAFLMAGTFGLGERINLFTTMYTEGCKIIIAAGIEKLIPGSARDAIGCAGRNSSKWSMGASIGLVPLIGDIISEIEAIRILFGIDPVVIGRGGINGAEGSTTMVASGDNNSLEALIQTIGWASEQKLSGMPESTKECERGVKACSRHVGCCYKSGKYFKKI